MNLDRYGKRLSDTTSSFDYESLVIKRSPDSVAEAFRPSFEARKDLYRLEVAQDQTAKNVVLERFTFLPRNVDVDLEPIFEKHAANRTEADRFYEAYLKATDPPLLNLKLVQKWVLTELANRKIEPDRTKKALESVLMKKMDEQPDGDSRAMMLGLQKTDILDRCLKILKNPE